MNAAREREVEQVTIAYQAALARLGATTTAEALKLWQDVPATQRAATAQRWLDQATRLVLLRRRSSLALARAYYRLARALVTGYTVDDPDRDEPSTITLGELRRQFEALAASGPRVDTSTGEVLDEPQALPQGRDGDSDRIPVEKIGVDSKAAQRAAEQEARVVLAQLGPNNLERKVRELNTDEPARDVDAKRKLVHDEAGARQAAAAERMAINGGRADSWSRQEGDKRALGYVRVSRTGTPCGWCAMLISRGFVEKNSSLYLSEDSAKFKGGGDRNATDNYDDGDKYHDNCKCVAIPVFSKDQMKSDPLFSLNREYGVLWPQVTDGLGGKSAVSAWRRFIRQQNADAKSAVRRAA